MRVALIFPPLCDPTAPYVSVPLLAAILRRAGHEVLPIDLNVEAAHLVLSGQFLERAASRIGQRIAKFERRPALGHREAQRYAALWAGRGEAQGIAAAAAGAERLLTGQRPGFDDRDAYAAAVATVERAFAVASAAWTPLSMNLRQYRTPLAMLDAASIDRDAEAARNPFRDLYAALADRIADWGADVVGISVAFPGQLLPGQILARALRARMPEALLLAGGPAIAQFFHGMPLDARNEALGPLDAVVLGDGDELFPQIVAAFASGDRARGVIVAERCASLAEIPAPDFAGMPLDRYLAPRLVLPYDFARGCYWGRCAFCHYGTVARGTAPYRVRPADTAAGHLRDLAARHDAAAFYLSEDALAPADAGRLARELKGSGIRWSTDIRAEHGLTLSLCRELAAGGLLSVSVGIESASPRTLARIDKGIDLEVMRTAVHHLSAAGIAVEAMTFGGFPGETAREALATLRFLADEREHFSLFIFGQFGLVRGSAVCADPAAYGVDEIWTVRGDRFQSGLFWSESGRGASPQEEAQIDDAVDRLSAGYALGQYPWAGALSTAHTQLGYLARGPHAFFVRPGESGGKPERLPGKIYPARFDVAALAARCGEAEAEIWEIMVHDERAVSLERYRQLAAGYALIREKPGVWQVAPGRVPRRA